MRVEPRLLRGLASGGVSGDVSGNALRDWLCRASQQATRTDVQVRGVRCADLVDEPVSGDIDFNDPHRAPPFYVVEHIKRQSLASKDRLTSVLLHTRIAGKRVTHVFADDFVTILIL